METLEQTVDYEIDGRHYAVKDVLKGTVFKIDNRIYLILENQLARFCNEVNLGMEPQTTAGGYFSRDLAR